MLPLSKKPSSSPAPTPKPSPAPSPKPASPAPSQSRNAPTPNRVEVARQSQSQPAPSRSATSATVSSAIQKYTTSAYIPSKTTTPSKPTTSKPPARNPGVAPGTGGSTATPEVFQPRPPKGPSPGHLGNPRLPIPPPEEDTTPKTDNFSAQSYSNPSAPDATPAHSWIRSSDYVAPTGIKQADPSIILFNTQSISPEFLLELEYESLSGMELINISRSDIIDGQDVVYSPVKNLSSIRRKYNPNNIINLSELSASFFSRFAIDLIQRGMKKPYFDNQGNLVIEIEDVRNDEIIEVEIDTNATIEEVIFI